jgi:glycolate oxidase
MAEEDQIYESLIEIVGKDFVSNRQEELYIYSRDPGTSKPRRVDYVVMPKTVEEVQGIVKLANKEKIPIVPMGGGLTLNGLTIPIKGGIVLDMKRMDRVIEVNEKSRYAIVEAGVSQGALQSYLKRNYPYLQHSMPDAPPIATIAGNVLIQGHGHLSVAYGINSQMVNGMEVVLPTGEVCKLGSCAISPYWFARDPLPDLMGLFFGWFGTTGIITKVSLQLFPKPKFRDLLTFTSADFDLMPNFIFDLIQLNLTENLFISSQEWPPWARDILYVPIISAQDEEEFKLKIELHKKLLRKYEGKITLVEGRHAERMRQQRLPVPPINIASAADVKQGGGYQYTGGILPIEKVPEATAKEVEIAHKYGQPYLLGHQVLTSGHSIMFGVGWCLNRADEEDIENIRKALDESNKLILDLGGVLWKAELPAQKLMMQIRKVLDPNGIMNPGNWEAD